MAEIHLQAIAHIENNDWQAAHQLIQTCNDPLAWHIHGFLHQLEGDMSNAEYWYRRADVPLTDADPATTLNRLKKLASA